MANKREKNHLVIGKCFMRVIKNHKLYNIFQNGCKDFVRHSESGRKAKNIMELFDLLANVASNDYNNHRRNAHDKYEPTTFVINTYLRHILEKQMMKSKQKLDLGMIGQEIFDLSCYKIFGEEFLIDMEEMNKNMPKAKNGMEMFFIGIYKDYLTRNGINEEDMPFEMFVERYNDSLKREYEKISSQYGW